MDWVFGILFVAYPFVIFFVIVGATSVSAQPAEGKILQTGKIIYINEIKSFGKVEDLEYHVMYKDSYYLCKFKGAAKDYFCDEITVIEEQ